MRKEATGDERWGRKADFGSSLRRPRHVTDPIKDQDKAIVKRRQSCRTKSEKSSRGNGRYFHSPVKDSDSTPSTADRKLCSCWVGPRLYMGLTTPGESRYRWIVG